MPYPLHVALIWHCHQPNVFSLGSAGTGHGGYQLPWIRLRGCQIYNGLVKLLGRYPLLRQTVGFSPCLLTQLGDYAQGTALDDHWALTLTPVAQLTPAQKIEILQQFFEADPQSQILPYPRYQALYEQRQRSGINWCVEHWQPQDFSDLLAWHNLIWFDPLSISEDRDLQHWLFHATAFSLGDRQRIISKQKQILQNLIPAYAALQTQSQLEIIASPYGHPILPLLADSNIARTLHPDVPLPDPRYCWSEDGTQHLLMAKQRYRQCFHREARGLWPPELAISPALLSSFAQCRFDWFCADEATVARSLNQPNRPQRLALGLDGDPLWLYHPQRLKTLDGDVTLIVRDGHLSEELQSGRDRLSPAQATQRFIQRLLNLYRQQQAHPSARPQLVTLTLTAETGWANDPQNGFRFLSQVFQRCQELVRQGVLKLTTVSEFLEQFPPTQIFPSDAHINLVGSGSPAGFTPWIGTPLKNKAWDYLIDARQTLANHPEATADNNPEAWQALYAAQSADGFAALTDAMTPQQCQLEALFRSHLIRLYRALNETVPGYLFHPLSSPSSVTPAGSLYPRWSDLRDLTPWRVAIAVPVVSNEVVQILYYGHNPQYLYLRVDFTAPLAAQIPDELHLWWYYPQVPHAHAPAAIADLPDHAPLNYYFHHHCFVNLKTQQAWHEVAFNPVTWQRSQQRPKVIQQDQILVVGLPVALLAQPPQSTLHFVAMLAEQGEFFSLLSGDRPLVWQWG